MKVILLGGAQDGQTGEVPESQTSIPEWRLNEKAYRAEMNSLGLDMIEGISVLSTLNPYSEEVVARHSTPNGAYIKLGQTNDKGEEVFVYTSTPLPAGVKKRIDENRPNLLETS